MIKPTRIECTRAGLVNITFGKEYDVHNLDGYEYQITDDKGFNTWLDKDHVEVLYQNKLAFVTVNSGPIYVECTCPHCGEEIEIAYSEFISDQLYDYPGDWDEFECPECYETIEIEELEWE
jgi:predicted RNA-binding Zn-ribbon protein involved in translation (DUF1610 family)